MLGARLNSDNPNVICSAVFRLEHIFDHEEIRQIREFAQFAWNRHGKLEFGWNEYIIQDYAHDPDENCQLCGSYSHNTWMCSHQQ